MSLIEMSTCQTDGIRNGLTVYDSATHENVQTSFEKLVLFGLSPQRIVKLLLQFGIFVKTTVLCAFVRTQIDIFQIHV